MLISEPLPFVRAYLEALDTQLRACSSAQRGLTRLQRHWLGFCLMGMMITESLCWARFERASAGRYSAWALTWRFRHAKLPWKWRLRVSVMVVLQHYGISQGVLIIDDVTNPRAKVTARIGYAHKSKHPGSGGFVNGQNLVVLLLVTERVSIPIDFRFYQPDPVAQQWRREDRRLRRQGLPKRQRPQPPARDPRYPSKLELALALLAAFRQAHPQVRVRCVVADALYSSGDFLDRASALFDGVQVIGQLRHNQRVRYRGRSRSVAAYFQRFPGVPQALRRRGGEPIPVVLGSARLYVNCHGKKRFVIALNYDGDDEYRYIVATEMTWRALDIAQARSLRWLIEVFFEDWKAHHGWVKLAKQPGEEGSVRGASLSLLLDHCLLLHPVQTACVEHRQPARTVGSLIHHTKVESLVQVIQAVVADPDPPARLQHLAETLQQLYPAAASSKHMVGRDLGRLEPTPSLRYRATG
jgi:hypothetical protein